MIRFVLIQVCIVSTFVPVPVFNGGDVGDVEDGDDRDDVTPAQELVNRLEDHPPEQVGDVRVRLTKKDR